MTAAEVLPELCPRVIGLREGGRHIETCGHTLPCPYHGLPAVRIVHPSKEAQPCPTS